MRHHADGSASATHPPMPLSIPGAVPCPLLGCCPSTLPTSVDFARRRVAPPRAGTSASRGPSSRIRIGLVDQLFRWPLTLGVRADHSVARIRYRSIAGSPACAFYGPVHHAQPGGVNTRNRCEVETEITATVRGWKRIWRSRNWPSTKSLLAGRPSATKLAAGSGRRPAILRGNSGWRRSSCWPRRRLPRAVALATGPDQMALASIADGLAPGAGRG